MSRPSGRPLFALDHNFPAPILDKASLDRWIPELSIQPLKAIDPRLTKDFEDWQVILGVQQLGAEGFVTCDENMLDNPQVIAVVDQLNCTLVVCAETGHDPVVATGLLLAHLPRVAKRHHSGRPQIWRLRPTEERPKKIQEFKDRIKKNSGEDVDDYKLEKGVLQAPLLSSTPRP